MFDKVGCSNLFFTILIRLLNCCFSLMLRHMSIFYVQDALRLYIINSPVVRAEPLRFKKEGVHGVVSIVFLFIFAFFLIVPFDFNFGKL